MTTARLTDDAELTLTASPTAHLLDELSLHGYRPYGDEPDPRPLPEPAKLRGALADIFDALVATLSDTRLEPDLQTLLWSVVNVFHRRIDRIERDLDDNERAQRTGQREQDGSEVSSLELERLVAQGLTLIERRNSFEFIRDAAAELYGLHTGQAWRPRTGSMVNRVMMTAAMIDYFCDGITDDIITELLRFSELFVIARNSSFQYRGRPSMSAKWAASLACVTSCRAAFAASATGFASWCSWPTP